MSHVSMWLLNRERLGWNSLATVIQASENNSSRHTLENFTVVQSVTGMWACLRTKGSHEIH